MLNYNEVYVLKINGSHWKGRKEELLQILNDYKTTSEREGVDFEFMFLQLKDYDKLRHLYLNDL